MNLYKFNIYAHVESTVTYLPNKQDRRLFRIHALSINAETDVFQNKMTTDTIQNTTSYIQRREDGGGAGGRKGNKQTITE